MRTGGIFFRAAPRAEAMPLSLSCRLRLDLGLCVWYAVLERPSVELKAALLGIAHDCVRGQQICVVDVEVKAILLDEVPTCEVFKISPIERVGILVLFFRGRVCTLAAHLPFRHGLREGSPKVSKLQLELASHHLVLSGCS